METLRKAMMRTDGPVGGCITLTVARRVPELVSPGQTHARRDSLSSLLTDSSGKRILRLLSDLERMYMPPTTLTALCLPITVTLFISFTVQISFVLTIVFVWEEK